MSKKKNEKQKDDSRTNQTFMIKGARLSRPNFFRQGTFKGKIQKFSCILMLDDVKGKHKKIAKAMLKHSKELIASGLDGVPPKATYLAIKTDVERDRMENNRDEYKKCVTLHVKNKVRPFILDSRGAPVEEDEANSKNMFYAGCRVDAKVNMWVWEGNGTAESNPMLGMDLLAIVHAGDDEPFGAPPVDFDEATDGFDFDEEDDEDWDDDEN